MNMNQIITQNQGKVGLLVVASYLLLPSLVNLTNVLIFGLVAFVAVKVLIPMWNNNQELQARQDECRSDILALDAQRKRSRKINLKF